MRKTDCEINNWLADWMVDNYDWITNATADCTENYGVDDIVFSAVTINGDIIVKENEVKSIKGGFCLKYGDKWNSYFSTDNPNGIIKKMVFGNVPPPIPITDVPYKWDSSDNRPIEAPMPPQFEHKYIYMLNAEDAKHNILNGKAYKVYDRNACLCYIAPDGMIFYNPTKLRDAFLGYAWYRNKSHTEEFGAKGKPTYELKAIFDLEKGKYNKANPPKNLFVK